MRQLTNVSTALLAMLLAIGFGCDSGDSTKKQSPQDQSATTQASTQAADSAAPALKVGIPHSTKEQYKPVPGKYGGRLVRDHLGEPKSFNPIVSSETSTSDYTQRMFEGLTRNNAFTGELEPGIAERWEVTPDGLTWTFYLRKDVKFNDGTPLTAEDVAFTWNDALFDASRPKDKKDPRWPGSMRDLTTFEGKSLRVEVVDPYTVKFITPVKMAILPDMAGSAMLLSKKKYQKMVADGTFGGAMGADAKSGDIVGTGPFMLGEYARGERVTLKRNPHYWRKDSAGQALPYLDEIVFILSRSLDAWYLNFERGVTDIYHMRHGKDVAGLKPKMQSGNFELYQLGPAHGMNFLCLNMNEAAAKAGKIPAYKVKLFRDQRFRQAISYAVDRNAIVRNILRNLGAPQYTDYANAPGFFKVDVQPIPHDVNKAKALLADMGLKDKNGDKILEDADGNKVQFTIVTNAGSTVREEMSQYIATDLRALGMEVNILFLEFNQLIDKLDVSYDWEAMVMGFTSTWDPHGGSNFWKSDSQNHLWWPKQEKPGFEWEKRMDEIFSQGIQELDKNKRKALYAEASRIAYEQQPVVFLVVPERVDAIRKRFGNLFPSPGPLTEFASFHNEDEIFILPGSK
ncbi:MAG TPA: ABC transporter substrate-binding protein [Tepidisphaeraceae bacterium]|jgi:peptide/nickel transport system substrate-binding protein